MALMPKEVYDDEEGAALLMLYDEDVAEKSF